MRDVKANYFTSQQDMQMKTASRSDGSATIRNSGLLRVVILVILGAYLILLLASHLLHESYGGITDDERQQWMRIDSHITRGMGALKGFDVTNVYIDYYGVINKIIPALIVLKLGLPISRYYQLTHITSVLLALATAVLLWWASRTSRLQFALLAPLLLLASPAFFGYSLMNIKDIPIAFFYTLFTCSLVWIYTYIQSFSIRTLFIASLVTGITGGLLISLRLTLLPIPIATFPLTLYLCLRNIDPKPMLVHFQSRKSLSAIAFAATVFVLTLLLTAFVTLPASWPAPMPYFINAFNTFRDYSAWQGCMTYMGECTSKSRTEGWTTWHYLSQWGLSQLTILNISSFFGATGLLAHIWTRGKRSQRYTVHEVAIILFACQAYIVVLLAIVSNANLYGGIRHLMFALPATAFLGSTLIHIIARTNASISLPIGRIRLRNLALAALFLSLAAVFIDMVALAPYQYTYFNELRRENLRAGTTETDSWSMSTGELYAKTNKVSNLFPHTGDGALHDTRVSLGITSPSTNQHTVSQYLQSPITLRMAGLGEDCDVISLVSRDYPFSGPKVIFSAVAECRRQHPSEGNKLINKEQEQPIKSAPQ